MTLTEYNMEQRSPEWYDVRRGIVTASTVGQLITVRSLTAVEFACPACEAGATLPCVSKRGSTPTPIKTLHPERATVAKESDAPPVIEVAASPESRALIAQLAAERITRWSDENYVTFDMQRGIDDEPRARDFYSNHSGHPVREVGFMVREIDGVKLGFSPDGLVDEDGFIEVKSRIPKKQVPVVISGAIPPEHVAQIQAGFWVSGRAWCDYISWAGGMEFWVVRVLPDPDWQTAIRDALVAAEQAITQMVNDYRAAVDGLPVTERTVMEVVI